MNAPTIPAPATPGIEHAEATRVAAAEYDRLLAFADELDGDDWSRRTDCPDWDVRDTLGHVLGMLELQADPADLMRQLSTAAKIAEGSGCLRLDALTALQVREHAHLTHEELLHGLHEAAPRGLAARSGTTPEQRAAIYSAGLPGEGPWTMGYLYDIIHTRDPWLHRVDISRATGKEMTLSAQHDGRIVADVVEDWAGRHDQPYTLTLTGPAGGTFTSGQVGPQHNLDAVEFCRILSGRERGDGLLATRVAF